MKFGYCYRILALVAFCLMHNAFAMDVPGAQPSENDQEQGQRSPGSDLLFGSFSPVVAQHQLQEPQQAVAQAPYVEAQQVVPQIGSLLPPVRSPEGFIGQQAEDLAGQQSQEFIRPAVFVEQDPIEAQRIESPPYVEVQPTVWQPSGIPRDQQRERALRLLVNMANTESAEQVVEVVVQFLESHLIDGSPEARAVLAGYIQWVATRLSLTRLDFFEALLTIQQCYQAQPGVENIAVAFLTSALLAYKMHSEYYVRLFAEHSLDNFFQTTLSLFGIQVVDSSYHEQELALLRCLDFTYLPLEFLNIQLEDTVVVDEEEVYVNDFISQLT